MFIKVALMNFLKKLFQAAVTEYFLKKVFFLTGGALVKHTKNKADDKIFAELEKSFESID